MSTDRLGSHWMLNTTTPVAGSRPNAARQQQPSSASSTQSPRPAGSVPAPCSAVHPNSVSTSTSNTGPSAPSPAYSSGSAKQYVDATTAEAHLTGYRSMGIVAPHRQTHAGVYYRFPKQQRHQRAYTHDITSASTVNGPAGGGANVSDGQQVSGYLYYYGGTSAGSSGSVDHQRRPNDGGCSGAGSGGGGQHGTLFQGPRRQHPPYYASSSSKRSQHGRQRCVNRNNNNVVGSVTHGNEAGLDSRIASTSSGAEMPPAQPPGVTPDNSNAEVDVGRGLVDLVISPPLPMSVTVTNNNNSSNTTNPSGAAALPHPHGGSSARRSSAGNGGGGGNGGTTLATTAAATSNRFVGGGGNAGVDPSLAESRGDRPAPRTSSSSPPPLSSSQQQQQQSSSVAVSRSGVSTSSPAAANPSAAVAAVAVAATAAGRYTRPRGEERPTVALSQNIMSVYQAINEIFYQERQRLLAAPAAKYAARKYEDTSGHYVPCEGEVIADRYVFKELVGQGSFGKVLYCIDRKYNEPVAVKVIRSGPYFENQGWFEAQVVAHLNNDPSLQNLVVQLRKVFLWKGHMVLVFEPLSFSLYKLITLTKHNGVSLDLTRKFAYQMVKVLLVLEQHQPPIIHCDLKPENVLLRDPSRSGVRVIDFGSACYQQQASWRLPPAQVVLPASSPSASAGPPWDVAEERKGGGIGVNIGNSANATSARAQPVTSSAAGETVALGNDGDGGATNSNLHQQTAAAGNTANTSDTMSATAAGPGAAAINTATSSNNLEVEVVMPKYIQSRYYRSPEVILELGYTTAIDCWSLGCFLTEMHTGRPLFQGNNEADMIAYFTMVLGPLPDYMIASSPKRTRLYHTCPMDNIVSGNGGAPPPPPQTLGGASTATAAAQALFSQQPRQQRAASPLLAFTTSTSPTLTPFTEAPGHAPGSPFFLRAPQIEDTESATAYAVRADGRDPPLAKVLGVHSGGPRGCRAGQPGHDEAAYEVFYDFIDKLLQYDPRKRMSSSQAIQHPFLEPIRVLEARAAAAAAVAAAAASHTHPRAEAPAAPAGEGSGGGGATPPPPAAGRGNATVTSMSTTATGLAPLGDKSTGAASA